MNVLVEEFSEKDRDPCKTILQNLHQWFGIEEANRAYIEVLGQFPTAVARIEGKVVGFAALEEHYQNSVELHVIAVSPKHHRAGIGKRLIDWSENWCRDRGIELFHVKTRGPSTPDPDYEKTRQFYFSQGFDELFESLTLWGPDDAALIMLKSITKDVNP